VLLDPELGAEPAGAVRAVLAEHLGWQVQDHDLFTQALAHRSWCAEHPGQEPNERLEFLGDAVLGLIVTDYLFRTYPELPEGELAKARAAVVNSVSLASTARELQLGDALLLGKGEDGSGGRRKSSILADAMEALIGAIYLDAGYGAADRIVLHLLEERLRESAKGPGEEDYKTRLQELCAQTFDELPVYRITDTGPDHAKIFAAEVLVGGRSGGRGEGRSKKQAEQMAARHAWYALKAEQVVDAHAPAAPEAAVPGAAERGAADSGTAAPGAAAERGPAGPEATDDGRGALSPAGATTALGTALAAPAEASPATPPAEA
jgi:ribonuclease III